MPQPPRPRPTPLGQSRRAVKFEVSVDGVVPTNETLRRRHPDVASMIPGAADGDRASFDTPEQAQEFADALASSTPVDLVYPRPAPQPDLDDTVTVLMTESQARAMARMLVPGLNLIGPMILSEEGLPTYTVETT